VTVCVVSANDLTHRVVACSRLAKTMNVWARYLGHPEDAEAVHGAVFEWM
jgi:hypothetical protein